MTFSDKRPGRGQIFFKNLWKNGLGAAKVIGSVGEGLTGNPMGFVDAAQHFGDMVKDKMDGKL